MLVLGPDFAESGRTMKKLFPVVALLLVAGAVVVGCSKPEDKPVTPPAPPTPGDVTNAVPAKP